MAHLLSTQDFVNLRHGGDGDATANAVRELNQDELFLSVVTLGELEAAIQQLGPDRSADRQTYEFELRFKIPAAFPGRILDVDSAVAHEWGQLLQRARALSLHASTPELLIAATAKHYALTLIASNGTALRQLGIDVLDPRES